MAFDYYMKVEGYKHKDKALEFTMNFMGIKSKECKEECMDLVHGVNDVISCVSDVTGFTKIIKLIWTKNMSLYDWHDAINKFIYYEEKYKNTNVIEKLKNLQHLITTYEWSRTKKYLVPVLVSFGFDFTADKVSSKIGSYK
jgi:hypothetical protein